jgi:hypothetical protein
VQTYPGERTRSTDTHLPALIEPYKRPRPDLSHCQQGILAARAVWLESGPWDGTAARKSPQGGRELIIRDCDALTSLKGLQGPIVGIKKKGWNLALVDNDGLTDLDSLADLESFGDRIYLQRNNNLADISALDLIVDPGETFELYIDENPALIDLVGLDSVLQATEIQVKRNAGLTSLKGLGGLENASLVVVADNPALVDLTGLTQLATVDRLWIEGNPALVSLAGLDALTTVKNSLAVGFCSTMGNAALTDLSGLEKLTSVKNLGVDGNASITSLAGLDGLQTLEGVWAQFNPLLPSAEAVALAGKFNATSTVCNNAGPPEMCMCIEWIE